METMAACLAALGRKAESQEWSEQVNRLEPVTGDALQPLWRQNRAWGESMRRWLAPDTP